MRYPNQVWVTVGQQSELSAVNARIAVVDDDVRELNVTDPNGTYADRMTVVFRTIDNQSSNTDIAPSIAMIVHPHGVGLDVEGLRVELEQLAQRHPFRSTASVHHTSWGADGAAAVFLLSVGGQVAGSVITDGLKRIGRAIVEARNRPAEPRPITEAEAISWATVVLVNRFDGIKTAELKVREVTLAESTATVALRSPDDSAYRVGLELVDGLIVLGEISRTYPDQSG
jgi:hypothetical protein